MGTHLPPAALHTAQDSIGGALAVAQHVATIPGAGPRQAAQLVAAAHESFAHAVAHTSVIGGLILAAGTVLVFLILPGRRTVNAPKATTAEAELAKVK